MPSTSPIVMRWELVLRIKRRRNDLGITRSHITKALGISPAYWSHVEGERNLLSEDKLRKLLDVLAFDEPEQRELLALHAGAKQRGWWANYSGIFGADQQKLFGLEDGAHSIRTYESIVIPGLLQTKEYARALMSSGILTVREVETDQRVEVRMRRQQCLDGDDPLRLTVVLGQAALMQQTGSQQVLYRQLEHLVTLIENHPDTIEIRVIPLTAAGGNALGGQTFHLLDFASPQLPTLAWLESAVSSETTDRPDMVRDLSFVYDKARAIALDPQGSLALIKQCARE